MPKITPPISAARIPPSKERAIVRDGPDIRPARCAREGPGIDLDGVAANRLDDENPGGAEEWSERERAAGEGR